MHMKIGNKKVDQITKEGVLVEGYDESLSPSEIFDRIAKCFPNVQKAQVDPRVLVGKHKGHSFAIRCKNVTYLGNPHPPYKKRIQISDDLYGFYQLALSIKAVPILLGIYSYRDNTIFVDFKIDTYIKKKAHNSSAHIYVSDLAAATEDGYFQKIDYFGNTVTAIRPDIVSVYLDELFSINGTAENNEVIFIEERPQFSISSEMGNSGLDNPDFFLKGENEKKSHSVLLESGNGWDNEDVLSRIELYEKEFRETIIPKIRDFFENETKDWNGVECYRKMIDANYRNKYQPEWVGFFLEFEFERYLIDHKLNALIKYAQNKKKGGIDLDLYFPKIEAYGDLKAHSEESSGIQGNDWETIFSIINAQDEKSHVYYIVCEHSTEKDSEYNYEVTTFWNKTRKKPNLMSYSKKMKHSAHLKRVYILDINYSNREHLTMFKQGINSNGKPRKPKIMIEHNNLQYFIIEQIEL